MDGSKCAWEGRGWNDKKCMTRQRSVMRSEVCACGMNELRSSKVKKRKIFFDKQCE